MFNLIQTVGGDVIRVFAGHMTLLLIADCHSPFNPFHLLLQAGVLFLICRLSIRIIHFIAVDKWRWPAPRGCLSRYSPSANIQIT